LPSVQHEEGGPPPARGRALARPPTFAAARAQLDRRRLRHRPPPLGALPPIHRPVRVTSCRRGRTRVGESPPAGLGPPPARGGSLVSPTACGRGSLGTPCQSEAEAGPAAMRKAGGVTARAEL